MIAAMACAGADGVTGQSGATGPAGVQGSTGNDGDTGAVGPAGDTGPAGENGDTGAVGATGSAGAIGPAGADGANGIDWPGLIPDAYTNADGIAGGSTYSKWYSTAGGGTGSIDTAVAADFYRCKSCHGWDGLGSSGSYADRTGQSTGKATRPDVAAVNLRASVLSETPGELYDLIARPTGRAIDAADNNHPAFADVLTSSQIWNLVKFMREEWIPPMEVYTMKVEGSAMHWDYSTAPATLVTPTRTYSDIGIGGVAGRGGAIYATTCAECHGNDGKAIDGLSVGQKIRTKPHEMWFKAKFGDPGTMPSGMVTELQDLKDLFKALTDTTNFPD